MNKGIFNRLTFLATTAFVAAVGVLCLGVGFYWFNIIVPSIRASEQTRAEMVMAQVVEKLENTLQKADRTGLEDMLVRLLLMKDPSTDKNLILGIRLETLEGAPLVEYSGGPVEISGPFAFTAPLYSPVTHEVLGEISFQYNPHFYERLIEDGRNKMFWLLGLMAGVIFLLQRFLLRLLRPLSELNKSLETLDTSGPARLPEIKGRVVSEIGEVIHAMQSLLGRLDVARMSEGQAREELEVAQSVSHTGNWVWDIVTNDLAWSDEVYRIFGLKPQEFEPTYEAFLDVVHPEDRDKVNEMVTKAMEGEGDYRLVHRLVHPDGTIRFVSEKSEVTFDDAGKAIKFVGTVQDITEQKLAEDRALRFGQIMDESFNEIYIIDEATLKFTRVNQSALQNIGYTHEEMASMTPHDIAPLLTREQMDGLFQTMRDGAETLPVIQTVHRRKDGTDYPVEVRLQLSMHESPAHFVAIVQDVTERRKAEQAMQHAMQSLEAKVQERTADLKKITRENELILEAAGEGIYGIDKEGLTTFLNPAAESILGYSSKELVGKPHHDLCHHKRADESTYPKKKCPIYKTLQDGTACKVSDEVFWKKDGTAVPVEYVSTPIFDGEAVVGAVVTFRDITDRKRVQQDLILAKEEAETYLDIAGSIIVSLNAHGDVILINKQGCDVLGYAREEIIGKNWFHNFLPERDRQSTYGAFEKLMRGETEGVDRYVNPIVNRSGEERLIEWQNAFFRNEQGEVEAILSSGRDVTEQREAEEALRESEERFRQLAENIDEVFWMSSPDPGDILYVSPSYETMFGGVLEELYADPGLWLEFIIPEDRPKVLELFTPEKLNQGLYDVEYRIIKPTGEMRWIAAKGFPVKNEKEEVIRIVGLCSDITERKNAEEELKKSEEKFRNYFELPLIGITITSPEKGWLDVNDALCDFLGYSRKELMQRTWAELTHPDDLESDVTQFNRVLKGEIDGYNMEKRYIHKSGEVIHAEISARCVRKANGEVDYLIALVQDINERKRAQQEMILAKEEAERASNAKSEFLSQMSHELRTPLNAILGFGQVMESDPEEPLTEYQEQSVSEILKAGKHLLDLINEILDLSRIESGHLSLSLENICLSDLTEELMTLCQPLASKGDIELLNYVPLHNDFFVHADRVRLKQILLNLMSNAIKYNKANGTVKIDATGNKKDGIRISVTDTGIGISKDQLADLFQPFNRLGSEKTDIEGTGVGLTITRRLVELMNGSIEVESQPGEGSTFSITLPVGDPEDATATLAEKEVDVKLSKLPSKEQWVVLYVEDNPANMNLVQQIFRRRPDVTLLTAPEAKLGIELAQAHRPDLILMDINLPGMDGIAAFRLLHALEETRKIPVIAVSANALPRDIKTALTIGFSDYLTKPLDIEEFTRVIEEHLHISLKRK